MEMMFGMGGGEQRSVRVSESARACARRVWVCAAVRACVRARVRACRACACVPCVRACRACVRARVCAGGRAEKCEDAVDR
eukprot:6191921-Pleurochrysis_carterae.AAC.2